ncbi:MAG: arginase [Clostridiales bacterium]|nr:arginase [Clostridiales bacterium]
MGRRFELIEAAVSCGSPTRGSEGAFDALVQAGLAGLFGDAGLMPMEKLAPCGRWPDGLRHLDTVMEVCRRLRANTLDALGRGKYPVVIGGDHSCAMGTLAALGEFYRPEDLAVVYVDAHTDINTERTSESGCIHGMDLAAACGLCCGELTVGRSKVNLLGENLHFIGARSIDPPEYGIVERVGAHLHTADEVRQRGLEAVLDEMLPALAGKHVHISFDVDVLDPSEFTATGYNIPDGLSAAQVERILGAVLDTGLTCSFECVEYNPAMDPDGKDLDVLMGILRTVPDKLR